MAMQPMCRLLDVCMLQGQLLAGASAGTLGKSAHANAAPQLQVLTAVL